MRARAVLRVVRRSVNEFRDNRWNAIVVARNRLTKSNIITGMTAYMLFAIAILLEADRLAIVGAATFYLVGAVTGLISRLYDEAGADTAVEDYGLAHARLLTTPLISGLVALGGVALSLLASGGSSHTLSEIFSLHNNVGSLVIAAVFGLTPGLFFTKLRQQAEGYKKDLKGSEVSMDEDKPAK